MSFIKNSHRKRHALPTGLHEISPLRVITCLGEIPYDKYAHNFVSYEFHKNTCSECH